MRERVLCTQPDLPAVLLQKLSGVTFHISASQTSSFLSDRRVAWRVWSGRPEGTRVSLRKNSLPLSSFKTKLICYSMRQCHNSHPDLSCLSVTGGDDMSAKLSYSNRAM